MVAAEIGVFGGSGFYSLLEDVREAKVDTPYGPPSDSVLLATVHGRRLAFLARHGRNHSIPPHKVNYRANVWAMRSLGVEAVISSDHGRTWDFGHRYVLATWTGNLKDERSWFCSVQSTSTVLLPHETLLTAFGTGFSNKADATRYKMDVALTKCG